MGNGCLLLLSEFFSIAFRASLLSSQRVAALEQNHGQKLATPGLPKARRWWRKQRFAAVCSSASWHLPSASVLGKFSVHCSYQRYLSFAKDCELLGGMGWKAANDTADANGIYPVWRSVGCTCYCLASFTAKLQPQTGPVWTFFHLS